MPSEQFLEQKAKWVRQVVLEAIAREGKGHIGGTYSCVDLLVYLYYSDIVRIDPKQPKRPDRDRFLMGKGHACLALFAIFQDLGMISAQDLEEYGKDGGRLGGQLDTSTPGVEYNTGSLGHVLGIGAGMALASRMDQSGFKAVVLLGDAECYEGSIWEAAMFAGQQKLSNLIAIVDRNRLSVTDFLGDEETFGSFTEKFSVFGWDTYQMNGHSFKEISQVFEKIKNAQKPSIIIAETIKGKGVSYMENGVKWHHSVPNPEELAQARKELA